MAKPPSLNMEHSRRTPKPKATGLEPSDALEQNPRGSEMPRWQFLMAIERSGSQVLDDLRIQLLPEFHKFLQSHGVSAREFYPALDGLVILESEASCRSWGMLWRSAVEALRGSLRTWGQAYWLWDALPQSGRHPSKREFDSSNHLRRSARASDSLFEFVLPVAVDTLAHWALGGIDSQLRWTLGADGELARIAAESCAKRLSFPTWDPTVESQAAFTERWRTFSEAALLSHTRHVVRSTERSVVAWRVSECLRYLPPDPFPDLWDSCSQLLDGTPETAAPRLRIDPSRLTREHFDWLVKRQVLGMPWSRIRASEVTDPSDGAIRSGVERAAYLLIGDDFKTWMRPFPAGARRAYS